MESIDSFAARLASITGRKVTVAHGQMDEVRLARAVDAFTSGETDILVSSTIIENGIDLPRANTMIVVDADRLGLSQLYQLRGRVGRSDRLAYVYFTYPAGKPLTDAGFKRLEAITQYTELGSGFKIAMADLEIRGAGNILGREQHGHLDKVGYDMYCKLLARAVGELKGESVRERGEVRASTDYKAFIPDDYISDGEQRFRAYARIAETDSAAARAQILAELKDVYGAVPPPCEKSRHRRPRQEPGGGSGRRARHRQQGRGRGGVRKGRGYSRVGDPRAQKRPGRPVWSWPTPPKSSGRAPAPPRRW